MKLILRTYQIDMSRSLSYKEFNLDKREYDKSEYDRIIYSN